MTVMPQPLLGTAEDPSGDRQCATIMEQMFSTLGEAVASLCGSP